MCSNKFSTSAVCWTAEVPKINETTEHLSITDSPEQVRRILLSTPVWEGSVLEQLALSFQDGKIALTFFFVAMCWAQGIIFLNQEMMNKHPCSTCTGIFKLLPFSFLSLKKLNQEITAENISSDRSLQLHGRKHLFIKTCLIKPNSSRLPFLYSKCEMS